MLCPSISLSTSCLMCSFTLYQDLLTHFSGSETYVLPLNSPSLLPCFIIFYFFPFCLCVVYMALFYLSSLRSPSHPERLHPCIPLFLLLFWHLSICLLFSCAWYYYIIIFESICCLLSGLFYVPGAETNRVEGEFESIRKSVCQFWCLYSVMWPEHNHPAGQQTA